MAFMRAFVSTNTQRFLLADNLDEPVMCGPNHIYLEPGLYDEDDTMPVARAHTVLSLLDEYKVLGSRSSRNTGAGWKHQATSTPLTS